MKYKPGGYSWLAVAPESKEELAIEKIEDRIHELKREYRKTHNKKILDEIKSLEAKLKNKPR